VSHLPSRAKRVESGAHEIDRLPVRLSGRFGCLGGGYRYRLIDTAGSELGVVDDERPAIDVGDSVTLPEEEGSAGVVVDVYDDEEHGREGGVVATLAVEID
jgi:hypothetical protein